MLLTGQIYRRKTSSELFNKYKTSRRFVWPHHLKTSLIRDDPELKGKSPHGLPLDRSARKESFILLLLAITIGVSTGIATVVFIGLIDWLGFFFYSGEYFPDLGDATYIFVPVIGALLGGPLIAWFAAEVKGHGVPEVMQALVRYDGKIRARVAVTKIVASALCIGTGGSAGREGPIVQVGAALGSNLGQRLRLSNLRIKNLVCSGAAAGIAATFNAPIAGVAFATELLMNEFQVKMFGNVVIAALSASIVSRMFLGNEPAFAVPVYTLNSPQEILLYILLGASAALVSVLFIRLLDRFEVLFEGWSFPSALKPAVGALLLGVCAYLYVKLVNFPGRPDAYPVTGHNHFSFPHIYGSGFHFMEQVLQGQGSLFILLGLVILKPLATSFTLGAGNSGGVFAPSLFTGAVFGGVFGHLVNICCPSIAAGVGAYALVGMAAVFAGAARAPLTAILIVFEMSGDYGLILPLMAAGISATFIADWLNPGSIYTMKLIRKGVHFEQGRDIDVLENVSVEEIMNPHAVTIHKDQSLSEVFVISYKTHIQGFPVMADEKHLYGFIAVHDLEDVLLRDAKANLQEIKVAEVVASPVLVAYPDEPVLAAIRKMSPRDLARLPVVSRGENGVLLGLISRSDILRAYEIGLSQRRGSFKQN